MYTEKSVAFEIEHDKCEVLDRNIRELDVRFEELQVKNRQLEGSMKSITADINRKQDRSE
jgi:hypothetical protein